MHIMYKQLMHKPKLGFVKIKNSLYLAQNIYILNKQATFLIIYNKACKRKGNTKYIL
jgi:hypothetical protein